MSGQQGVPAMDPADYEGWYHTPRGAWIGEREFVLLWRLMRAAGEPAGASLLDVGCGTGYFTRRFAAAGMRVTGVDPDLDMLAFARARDTDIPYIEGRAEALPFPDAGFDYVSAVTSLCFVADPQRALVEMWRVARRGVVLGLLNRHSLLHWRKSGRGAYAGARWDTLADVERWAERLRPMPVGMESATAILLPGGGPVARYVERIAGTRLPWGGFLAVCLHKRPA